MLCTYACDCYLHNSFHRNEGLPKRRKIKNPLRFQKKSSKLNNRTKPTLLSRKVLHKPPSFFNPKPIQLEHIKDQDNRNDKFN